MKITAREKRIIKKYGEFFNNTGGNDALELIGRKGVNMFNNSVVCLLQACVQSQVGIIARLEDEGILYPKA